MTLGRAPDAAEWHALLSAGYTTDEQRAALGDTATPAQAGATSTTTFF